MHGSEGTDRHIRTAAALRAKRCEGGNQMETKQMANIPKAI
jgi:hypothetical protein